MLTWIDDWGCKNTMPPDKAAEVLRVFFNEWPGGMEEIESSQAQWRRVASVLATFAQEVMMGAIKPEEMAEKARMALMRTTLIDLERVVALTSGD